MHAQQPYRAHPRWRIHAAACICGGASAAQARRRLGGASALLATLVAAIPVPTAAAAAFPVQRVAEGVYAHLGVQADANLQNRGDIANIGFVIGSRCVAVIDTGGSHAIGNALLQAIRAQTQVPVCYVINTHMHPDHLFGNSAFATIDEIQFIGHSKLPPALAARRDSYLRALHDQIGADAADNPLVPTDHPVSGSLALDLGGRVLTLQAWPTAHTDNDLTVFDEKTGTLWTGDLLFVDRIPVIDGSVLGWHKVIASLRDQKPQHVVPGHGPIDPPWPAALENEARYLDRLTTDTRAALKRGQTLTQAIESAGDSERSQWLLFDNYNRRNATACYTELEWEE